jgi:hypothetical protein
MWRNLKKLTGKVPKEKKTPVSGFMKSISDPSEKIKEAAEF